VIGSRGIAIGALALVVAATMAGCASSSDQVSVDLPPQNISQWAMPLDRYMAVTDIAADYAENLLMTPCMRNLGYEWVVPWRDIGADHGPTWNDVDRRLFNAEIAQDWGYHTSSSTDSGLADWQEFVSQPVSDSMAADIVTCRTEVRKDLPRLDPSTQLGSGLAASAFEGALVDDAVKAAAVQWRECMGDAGVPDLPATPSGMPSPSLSSRFDLGPDSEPSVDEILIATKDATCRESSGYLDATYQAEWELQVTALKQNVDALNGFAVQVEENKRAVLKAISENAPSRP